MLRMGILFFMMILICSLAAAEEQAVTHPKIAVVLSGGGARGFAHVGVLQWLEEHHIPVDMVVGTSMGGLIGGMYSMGMTPQELQEMIAAIDWAELFRPVPAYDSLSFRRKEDRRAFPNHLEFGLRGGLKIPPGVNTGHAIGLLLNRYTLPYSMVNDFDQLPIPFRCVATDMVEAKQVILRSGSLSMALQATMAIPGVFYPVEISGQILASDGGLLNNVPTDVAETMNPDIIIAVNIGTPLGKRESLDNLGGMLSQIISVTMNQNIVNNLDPSLHPKLKVIVQPDLKEYTTFDFDRYRQIADLGYREAEHMSSDLLGYALPEAEWEAYLQARRNRMRRESDLPSPEFIRITGTSVQSQARMQQILDQNVSKPVEPDSLEKELTTIWGNGEYAGLSYELVEEGGKPGLLVHAREKGYAPPILNLGLEVNNTQTDVFDFNLRGRVTLMNLSHPGTEWRIDTSIGSHISAELEYYRLLGRTRFFIAPRASYDRTKSGYFRDQVEIGEYELDSELLGADIGYNLNSTDEFRIGYDFGHQKGTVRIGDPGLPEGGGKSSAAHLDWVHDSVDSAVIPTHGARIASSLIWNFDVPIGTPQEVDQAFPQGSLRGTFFFPLGKKNTLFVLGEGDTSFHHSAPGLNKFALGGLFRISAASRNEFLGNHAVYGGVGYLRTLGRLPYLIGEKFSAGVWYETGAAYNRWDDADFHHSVATGVIVETLLGPVFTGFGFGDGGRNNFFFAIGRAF